MKLPLLMNIKTSRKRPDEPEKIADALEKSIGPLQEKIARLEETVSTFGTTQEYANIIQKYEALVEESQEYASVIQKYEVLVEETHAVVFVIDNDGTLMYVNPYTYKLFGYPEKSLEGKSYELLVYLDDLPKVKELFAKIGEDDDEPHNNRNIGYDGTVFHMQWTNRRVHYTGSSRKEFICVGFDVTAKELALQRWKLWVRHINHDLLTPLTNIVHSSQRLHEMHWLVAQSDELDQVHPQVLELMANKGDFIARELDLTANDGRFVLHLLWDMLADVEADPQCDKLVESELFDSASWIDEVKGALRREFDKKRNVQFERYIDVKWISGDLRKCQRILFNLLKNALDACDDEKNETISVHLKQDDSSCELKYPFIRIEVRDTGKGMTPEQARRYFTESDFQEDLSTTGTLSSRGKMGLKIVKRLVDQHGGEVGYDNEPGRGSRFWFLLPEDPGALQREAHLEAAQRKEPKLRRASTYLVLGQEGEYRQIVKDVLTFCNGQVFESATVENYLEETEVSPDIVLVYVQEQPTIRESDWVGKVRNHWPNAAIIFLLQGKNLARTHDLQSKCALEDSISYVPLPVDTMEFAQEVIRLLPSAS